MGTVFRSLDASNCDSKSLLSEASRELPEDWADLLKRTIEAEIIPHLLSSRGLGVGQTLSARAGRPRAEDIAAFVALIIDDDIEACRALADRVIDLSGGRDALLHEWLTPAARLLGDMWVQDRCDFTTVTLGVIRLDQLMKETALATADDFTMRALGRTILLAPAPGEQHSFGLNMVADVFREGGWCVRSGPDLSRPRLIELVACEWFDMVGLSVTSDRALKNLPACIRAVRQASCNRAVGVIVGGRAIFEHVERSRFLGADTVSNDPRQALRQANLFVEATVTKRLHQSKTELVDIG